MDISDDDARYSFLFFNRYEPGDGEIDLSGGFRNRTIVVHCKVNIVIILLFYFSSLTATRFIDH